MIWLIITSYLLSCLNTRTRTLALSTDGGSYISYQTVNYEEGFRDIRSSVFWPAPRSTLCSISSGFGPRTTSAESKFYDFHRGIDISGSVGDPVVAAHTGIVHGLYDWTGCGLTIVLRHEFLHSIIFHENKPPVRWYYTFYCHLDAFAVSVGTTVLGGSVIGTVGLTGRTSGPHLHFEVRLGTVCSLEFALDNVDDRDCNEDFVDPHINPLAMFKHLSCATDVIQKPILNEVLTLSQTSDARINVRTEDSDAAILKMYTICIVRARGTTRNCWTLNLDLRLGFDATSTESLDNPDLSRPWLDPQTFGAWERSWDIDFVIPYTWVGYKRAGELFLVMVRDVWGEESSIYFGDMSQAWDRVKTDGRFFNNCPPNSEPCHYRDSRSCCNFESRR